MIYSSIVKMKIRQTLDDANNHRWDKVTEALVPDAHHRVSGDHALGGVRHDKQSIRQWFERLGRVLPSLHIKPTEVTVQGWPWNTRVFAQWNSKAPLIDGSHYINRGLLVFTLRWGRVHSIEEYQDTQAIARALQAQSAAGVEEAGARPIVS